MKTRDLKKHYRSLEREVRDFQLDLSEESWYNLWHTHLDWSGITNISYKHRRLHFSCYLKILDKIERLTADTKKDFQTWIFLDGKEGWLDAIYFNTPNPHHSFPYELDNIEWNVEISFIALNFLDPFEFNVGRLSHENIYSYIIQKKGLGLSVGSKNQD